LSSAIVFTGLSFGTRNSSSTYFALLGLVAKILNNPGCAISPIARFAEPGAVGAAVGAAGEHRFHHLLRAGELQRLDVEAGLLEVAFLHGREERQSGRHRPVADPDLRCALRADDRRRADHAESGTCDRR
jgi:hypothetical protein